MIGMATGSVRKRNAIQTRLPVQVLEDKNMRAKRYFLYRQFAPNASQTPLSVHSPFTIYAISSTLLAKAIRNKTKVLRNVRQGGFGDTSCQTPPSLPRTWRMA
jgi:hypothetical protein